MELKSTRLRFISASSAELLSMAVSSLPFKVEMKGTPSLQADGVWYAWFVIPDFVPEFVNVRVPA